MNHWEKMDKACVLLKSLDLDGLTLNESREILDLAVKSIPIQNESGFDSIDIVKHKRTPKTT